MKTIYTTMLAAMVGGLFACSTTTNTDGGTTTGGSTTTTTTGGTTTGTTTGTSSGTTSGTTTGTTTGTTGGFPAVPALGAEIDRMGRPAVNTALTAPLDVLALPDGGAINGAAAKDLYNADQNPTDWVGNWAPPFAGNLAVYDALDAVCGNQPPGLPDAGQTATRYQTLAGVLADDELYVDTSVGSCSIYLGVELELLGALPAGTDCGGRTPLENTIDETYSLLAIGALSGVTNGITVDGDGVASLSAFPFLASPNP